MSEGSATLRVVAMKRLGGRVRGGGSAVSGWWFNVAWHANINAAAAGRRWLPANWLCLAKTDFSQQWSWEGRNRAL